MIIIADECVDFQIVQVLKDLGHDVDYIGLERSGITDEQVIDIAKQKKGIILTADKDFGELTYRLFLFNYGIIFYRLSGCSNDEKKKIILNAFENYGDKFANNFTVITKSGIRLRNLTFLR